MNRAFAVAACTPLTLLALHIPTETAHATSITSQEIVMRKAPKPKPHKPPKWHPAPSRVAVADFGAKTDGSDASTQIQTALNSGAQVVTLGPTGTFRAAVTVPAGVAFESDGATMILFRLRPPGSRERRRQRGHPEPNYRHVNCCRPSHYRGRSLQVVIVSLTSPATATGTASSWKTRASLLPNVIVVNSTFSHTSYGILRQLTDLTCARITGNTFRNIHRGDAIELNVGTDKDVRVTGNDVARVYMDGTGYGGIGIGIAGTGEYGDPLVAHDFLVSGNMVKNCESENIHFEKVRDSKVKTTRWQSAPGLVLVSSTTGVPVWTSTATLSIT